MRRCFIIYVFIVLVFSSCQKIEPPILPSIGNSSSVNDMGKGREIVFGAKTLISAGTKASSLDSLHVSRGMSVMVLSEDMPDSLFVSATKASEVTSLSSFYVSAVKGSAGSETSVFTSSEFTQVPASDPAVYSSSRMWGLSDEGWNFYASNLPLTFNAAGTTVSASNGIDVVSAYLTDGTYLAQNTFVFEHIFARLCDVTVSAVEPYTVSDVSIFIIPKTGGTFNIRTGSWSDVSSGSPVNIAGVSPGTKSNDIFLVPGAYSLSAAWTVSSGNFTDSYADICVDVELVAGKRNHILVSLGSAGPVIEYVHTLSVSPSSSNISIGGTQEFEATYYTYESVDGVTDWDNPVSVESVTASYSSGDVSVATVDGAVVTGVSEGSVVITAEYEGESATASLSVSDGVSGYDTPVVSVSYTGSISAAGGSLTPSLSYEQTVHYLSGKTEKITSGGSISYSGSADGFTLNSSTGVLSATANQGVERSITVTASVTLNGKTGSSSVTVLQNADGVSSYDTPAVSLSYDGFNAAGGTNSPSLSYSQTVHYVSGRTSTISSGGSVSYSGSAAGFTLNTSTGALTASANEGVVRSITVTAMVTLNGKSGSASASVSQNADSVSSYDTPSVIVSYSGFGAAGGTNSPSLSYSQTVYYASGKTSTVTSGGSVSYSGSATGFSLNASSGALTASANTGSDRSITVTASVTLNGKTGSGSATVSQSADSISSYGTPSVSVSYSGFGAAGGTNSPSLSYSQTVYYASGRTSTVTSGGSVSYSGSATGFSVNASSGALTASANTGSARSITVTASVTLNGKTGSGSATVSQSADSVVNYHYNDRLIAYGTPSVSIGSGITAGGGSATISGSVSNTWQDQTLYASGRVVDNTARSVAGSVSYAEVSDPNGRFSVSGSTLSHSSMGKSVTTDQVTVRCYNASNTGYYKDASTSVANSYSDSWGNKQYGDPYYGDKSYGNVYNGSKSYGNVYNGTKSYGSVYNGTKTYGNVYNGSKSYGNVYNGSKSYGSVYNGSQTNNWYVGDKEYGGYWWGDWYNNGSVYDSGSASCYSSESLGRSYGAYYSSTRYSIYSYNQFSLSKSTNQVYITDFLREYLMLDARVESCSCRDWTESTRYYYSQPRVEPIRRDQYRSWTRYNYNNWSYPRYRDYSMPRYRDWSMPRYRDWSMPRYRDYSMPRYRDYSVGRYRSWNRYGTRTYTSGATDGLSDSGTWEYLDTQYGTDQYDTQTGTDQYDTQTGKEQYDTQTGTEQYDTQYGTDQYDTQTGTDQYDTQSGTSKGSAYDSGNDYITYETSTRGAAARTYSSDQVTGSGTETTVVSSRFYNVDDITLTAKGYQVSGFASSSPVSIVKVGKKPYIRIVMTTIGPNQSTPYVANFIDLTFGTTTINLYGSISK